MSHGKNTRLLINEFDYSTIFQNSAVPTSVDMAENTTYQSESKTYEPGLDDGEMTLEAVYRDSDRMGNFWAARKTTKLLASRAIDGFAVGNAAQSVYGWLKALDIPAPVGDIVKTTSAIQGAAGFGVSLHDLIVAETAVGFETSIDQAAASTDGAYGVLHVVNFSGTDIDVVIQDSPNDSTWADLVTFTAATGVTSEIIEVAGAVDRYIRTEWSGTFTTAEFAVAFGRN